MGSFSPIAASIYDVFREFARGVHPYQSGGNPEGKSQALPIRAVIVFPDFNPRGAGSSLAAMIRWHHPGREHRASDRYIPVRTPSPLARSIS
jgi:hypothetical protein